MTMPLKNLERIHERARPHLDDYVAGLDTELGSNLKAVSVYGSATGPDFIPKKSNINLVVILGKLDEQVLTSLLDIVKWGRGKRIVPPLMLTPEYIKASLDVFPIEFLEIRDSHVVIMGEDYFSALQVEPRDVRLECESQLKAAVLRTRQAYLEVGWRRKGAEEVLAASLTSLIPVFRAMLRLKGEEPPRKKSDVVGSLGMAFGVETKTFIAILRDRAGDERIEGEMAHAVLARYIDEIAHLAGKVDDL
jgi:hypothetical protein